MPVQRHQSLIAREGLPYCIALFVLSVVLTYALGYTWSLPSWGLLAIMCYVFRDPARDIPPDPLAILSPVDG